jgi:CHAT domain-containing protein
MVYTDLAAFCSNREEDLVKAVEKYTEAAEIRKKLALEKDLSATLLSLGNVYSLFTIIDINNEINLEKVIETYKEAAAICDKLNLKRDLAKILHNLGMFYEKQDIFSEAIACYRKSLTILEKMNVFTDSQRTGTNLGNLAFKKGDWETALEGYEPALKAIEMMRGYLKDDGKRQKVLVDSLTIYANAIQCCINLKQYKKAIEISERARSRHLVELMASADLYQKGQIPEEILLYLSQYQDIQNRINQILQQRPDEGDTFLGGSTLLGGFTLDNLRADQTAQNEILKTLFQEKQTVWQELRQRDPVLAGTLEVPEFTWQDLTTLLQHQPQTALLSFYTTSDKLHIFFIVRPTDNPDDPLNISLHTCENQGYLTLQAWLWEEWFNPYVQISAPENTENEKNLLKQWIERMPDRLQTLADHLDLNTLTQTHLDQIQELIIIPHFLLHQIPLAALPIGDHYLGDQYRLRIVPSAQILKYCQDRENNNSHAPFVPASHLGTVEAAGSQSDISLYIVNLGFELIAQSLGIPKSQRIQREQATRDRYHHLAHNRHIQALHSIHHAAANLSDPHLSALLLADGNISLQELISPQWRMPQMIDVLLTCCETHLGNPNFTDDILTLGTGFLCAGARSVVSTLWQVDALATTFFCEFYYDYRQQGSDRPTALYQAQTQLRTLSKKETLKRVEKYLEVTYANRQQQPKVYNILSRQYAQLNSDRSQKPPYASPYYWAGFTLQGLR